MYRRRLLDVSLYDVLKGTALPANTCPHCGAALTSAEEPLRTKLVAP